MLTRQQIDQFHRDGFLILRGVFRGAELDELRRAADKVQEEAAAFKGSHHLYRDIPGKGKVYFRSEKMWERDPIFRAATVKPELLACIGQCIGHPFRPINDSFVCKLPAGNVPIHWHQDPPYGFNAQAPDETFEIPNFDVDIYLDKSTPENGCVWGIPGHHLAGKIDLKKFSEDELFRDFGALPMIMEPGDVLFHSLSAPHGSIGNTSNSIRRIFYVHYMAEEVLAHCYANWKDKRGFGADGIAFDRELLRAREKLGYSIDLAGQQVELTERGFAFNGTPNTPPRYWGKLIAGMCPAEKARKRALERVAVLAG